MARVPQITELGHNTMLVNHAGYGVTPECLEAKFHTGQVLKAKGRKEFCSVAAIVPPGFAADYALADLLKNPRPLMISRPLRCISYIVGFVGDPVPYVYRERNLKATAEPDSMVQWTDTTLPPGGEDE